VTAFCCQQCHGEDLSGKPEIGQRFKAGVAVPQCHCGARQPATGSGPRACSARSMVFSTRRLGYTSAWRQA